MRSHSLNYFACIRFFLSRHATQNTIFFIHNFLYLTAHSEILIRNLDSPQSSTRTVRKEETGRNEQITQS